MNVASAVNIDDLRGLARRRLPRILFDWIDGGAGDETALVNIQISGLRGRRQASTTARHPRGLRLGGQRASRATVKTRSRDAPLTRRSARPQCANSGHSRTSWRTGKSDPLLPFKIDPVNER